MNPYTVKPENNVVALFGSVGELVHFVEDKTFPSNWRRTLFSYSCREGVEWHGSRSMGEALEEWRSGWPKGMAALRALTTNLPDLLWTPWKKQRFVPALAGGLLNVPRYCAGEPEHFMQKEPDPTKEKLQVRVANLHVELRMNSGYQAAEGLSWGVGLCSVIDILETAGMSVELKVCHKTRTESSSIYGEVVVKASGEPLHVPTALFAVAHPSFYRRLLFVTTERAPLPEYLLCEYYASYGRPVSCLAEDRGAGLLLPGLQTVTSSAPHMRTANPLQWRNYYLELVAESREFYEVSEALREFLNAAKAA